MLHTRGIILRTIKYGETSVIADIFTEEKGLATFIGGSVRTAKSAMPYSLFQPMMVIDFVSYWREDQQAMHRLKEVRASEVWQAIPFDLRRGAVALFMAEVCRKCVQHGETNEPFFEALLHTLRHLDRTTEPIAQIHLHFLLQVSGFMGFQPTDEPDTPDACFLDLKEGTFTAIPPIHGLYMNPAEVVAVLALIHIPVEMCHTVPIDRSDRKRLLQKLLQFFQIHVPGFQEIHTPDILDMVMGG